MGSSTTPLSQGRQKAGPGRYKITTGRMKTLIADARRTFRRNGSTLTYPSQDVALVALGAPGNRPGTHWQLDGVDGPAGPTVSVLVGAVVTVDVADGDPDHPHGFELPTAALPYLHMAMMAGETARPSSVRCLERRHESSDQASSGRGERMRRG